MRRHTPARHCFYASLTALLLAGPLVEAADAPPVTVAVRPSITWAGGDVRTTVRTPRDPRNRELRIVVEAADEYASSDVQLDGDAAAATHQFTWKALPGGAYRVEAILLREDGHKETVSSCFAVLTGDDAGSDVGGARSRTPVPQGSSAGC
jgi:hypothetical protein